MRKVLVATMMGTALLSMPSLMLSAQAKTTAKHAAPKVETLNIKIAAGVGKQDWPKFEPANVTLPANTVVKVRLENYDDGAASIPAGYNQVKGTLGGTEIVNGKTVKLIGTKDVSHTISIGSINLNIPIPPKTGNEKFSTVQFTFKTPAKAQQLQWQCMAACGTGSSGWMGPMMDNGWMKGVFTIK